MPRSEADWLKEISSHVPQRSDYVELGEFEDLSTYRAEIAEFSKEELEEWEEFVQSNNLAVPIEQCCDDGQIVDDAQIERRLLGCPEDTRADCLLFLRDAPDDIRLCIAYYCYLLVGFERKRRTGSVVWPFPSGSPEVLRDLMFKWGPRFTRRR